MDKKDESNKKDKKHISQTALVKYDYISSAEDELTLKTGDVITDLVEVDEDWWEGTLNGKTGMFPAQLVEITGKKDSDTEGGSSKAASPLKGKTVIAMYDSVAETDGELTMNAGDVITDVVREDGGWLHGNLNGKMGIFPASYVKDKDDCDFFTMQEMQVVALYDYTSEDPDDLTIKAGDIITEVFQVDEGWMGGCLNGNSGIFPANYVEVIESAPSKL